MVLSYFLSTLPKTKKMRSSKLGASFLFYGAERVGFKPTVH